MNDFRCSCGCQDVFTLCCCCARCCLWSLSASSSRSPMLFPAALPRDRAPAWLPLHPAPPDTLCCWLCCRNFMINSCCWRHCCKTQTYKRVRHLKHFIMQQSWPSMWEGAHLFSSIKLLLLSPLLFLLLPALFLPPFPLLFFTLHPEFSFTPLLDLTHGRHTLN